MTVQVFKQATADVGEGPSWDVASQTLLWVDIHGMEVWREDFSGNSSCLTLDQHVGAAMATTTPGELLLMQRDGFYRQSADGTIAPLACPLADRPEVRFNDGKVDPRGRAFGGTMPYTQGTGTGALFRLDAGPSLTTVVDPVGLANGLGWTADQRRMYFVDSTAQTVHSFEYDADSGELGAHSVLVEIPEAEGLPDGLTVDDDGCVWLALFGAGALRRYTPDGRLDRVVELPVTQPTSLCFAGPDLSSLVVTTARFSLTPDQLAAQPLAGSLFAVETGCTGPGATPWASL